MIGDFLLREWTLPYGRVSGSVGCEGTARVPGDRIPLAAVAEAEEFVGVGGGVGEDDVDAIEFGGVVDGGFGVAELLEKWGDDGVVVDDEDGVGGFGGGGEVVVDGGAFVGGGRGAGAGHGGGAGWFLEPWTWARFRV